MAREIDCGRYYLTTPKLETELCKRHRVLDLQHNLRLIMTPPLAHYFSPGVLRIKAKDLQERGD